jgi:hypothetical protein
MQAIIRLDPNYEAHLEFIAIFNDWEDGSTITVSSNLPYNGADLETLRIKAKEKAMVLIRELANHPDF